jgi:hypothetical protein
VTSGRRKFTDISERHIASIFKAREYVKHVTSKKEKTKITVCLLCDVGGISETSMNFYLTTRNYIPQLSIYTSE